MLRHRPERNLSTGVESSRVKDEEGEEGYDQDTIDYFGLLVE